VLRRLQAVRRSFLKVARLTEGPVFTFHREQDGILPAVRTSTASNTVGSIFLRISPVPYGTWRAVNLSFRRWHGTQDAKTLFFQSIVSSRGSFRVVCTSLRGLSIASLSFSHPLLTSRLVHVNIVPQNLVSISRMEA
jgi:hypothetical protein